MKSETEVALDDHLKGTKTRLDKVYADTLAAAAKKSRQEISAQILSALVTRYGTVINNEDYEGRHIETALRITDKLIQELDK